MKQKKPEDHKLENTYKSRNLITRIYFRLKAWLSIKLVKLDKKDVILDFGCGGGWLEHKLRDYKIYGYDINSEKTFIEDYRKVKPDKIFVLDVFEHIPLKEIKEIINNFKKLNDGFDIIVSLPTENWLSRKVRKFVGKKEVPEEHITSYKQVLKILKENFKLKREINFFTVSKICLFEYKG
jgi:SAM-dependent methyltransferase